MKRNQKNKFCFFVSSKDNLCNNVYERNNIKFDIVLSRPLYMW